MREEGREPGQGAPASGCWSGCRAHSTPGKKAHLERKTQRVLYGAVRDARWAGRPGEEEMGDPRPEGREPGATVAFGQRARTRALRRAVPITAGEQRARCILGSAVSKGETTGQFKRGVTGPGLTF